MAKKISSLSIILGATVAPFVGAFDSVKSTLSGFASSISSAGSTLLKFTGIGAAIGAIAGGAGIGLLINSSLDAIDVSAKLSDRLGISTEALAGFQHASNLAGISNEQLTGGLEKMLKNVGKAAQDGGQLAKSFTDIGLDAKTLANQSPEVAFEQIADALKGIENPAARATAATEIFGKSGQELLPLLMSGSEGIKAAMKEADALGLSFSRIDAAKVEEANDAMTRVKSAVTGVFNSIVIALAPALTSVATFLTGVGIKVVSAVKAFLPTVLTVLGNLWAGVQTVFSAIWNFVSPIVSAIFQFIASNWEATLNTTVNLFTGIWNVISSVLGIVWNIVQTVWTGVVAVWDWALNLIGVKTADTGNSIGNTFQNIVDFANWLKDGIAFALNVAAYAITHWRDTFALAASEVALFIIRTGNQIAYTFTEVIPALLVWFANNWKEIFTDIFNGTMAIFANMGTNIANFFSAVWSALKGDGFDFEWTGLLTGFESTLKELPKIAEREVGPLEAALQSQTDALRDAYGKGLGDYLVAQQHDAAGALKKGLDNLTSQVKTPEIAAPKIETPKIPPIDTAPLDKTKKAAKETREELKALTSGSAESQLASYLAGWNSIAEIMPEASTNKSSPIPSPQPLPSQTAKAVQESGNESALLKQLVELAIARNSKLDDIKRSDGSLDLIQL